MFSDLRAGADALPIVASSRPARHDSRVQSAVPMKRFGAEIFADLIGLSTAELGPLMTAILLAGRSGPLRSEIGTMRQPGSRRFDDHGLSPVRFLVTPRIIALLMTPLLVLFSDLSNGRRRRHDAVVLDPDRDVPEGDRQCGHQSTSGRVRQVVRVRRADRGYRLPPWPAD
jgi:hypothetical protein